MISLRILVLDDEKDHCDLHRSRLEVDGHQVATATDFAQGLELLRQHSFHVVLLDWQWHTLPLTGPEVLARVRDADKDVGIIIVTGHPSHQNANLSMDHDVTAYLPKSSDLEEFRAAIERVIRKKGLAPLGEDLLNQVVGTNVRNLRRQHDLTLKDLSRRTGLSQSLISQLERADSSVSLSSLFKVAAALGVRLVDLFAGYEGPSKGPSTPPREGPGSS